MRRYINVYFITREYGGPEEGGWWYDLETSADKADLPNHLSPSMTYSSKVKRDAEAWVESENEGQPPLYSVASRGLYVVRVEEHRSKVYPASRPHYE